MSKLTESEEKELLSLKSESKRMIEQYCNQLGCKSCPIYRGEDEPCRLIINDRRELDLEMKDYV